MTIWTGPFIALWVVMTFLMCSVVIIYAVIKTQLESQIETASELCSNDFLAYDWFKDSPTQTMHVYVFNISNPGEFLKGESAEMHELGPYDYDLKIHRRNIEFSNGGSQMDFVVHNELNFNPDKVCNGCQHPFDEKITVLNPIYSAMIAGATSESTLFLSMSCKANQISNMRLPAPAAYPPPAVPYCLATQVGAGTPPANCRCCLPPVDGFNPPNATEYTRVNYARCSTLTHPQGPQAGLVGWLGSYDGAYKLNSLTAPPGMPSGGFALSTGTYTNYLRTVSVSELISGSVSALAGFFNYASSLQTLQMTPTDSTARATQYSITNTTQDIKDVCHNVHLKLCPYFSNITAAVAGITNANPMIQQAQRVNYIKSIKCTGSVPNYKVLIEDGQMSEERALELRYLEGFNCAPFGATLAFNALIASNMANMGTCADGTTNYPCCLKSFKLGSQPAGAGMGCLAFVPGLLQQRRVYSADEAAEKVGSVVSQKTVCTSSEPLKLYNWFGQTTYNEWFTPTSYTFPNMPWADPLIINAANRGMGMGTFSTESVSDGRAVNQIVGAGAGPSFLTRHLNGGRVEDKEYDIFATALNRIRTAQHRGFRDEYGLRAAIYRIKEQYDSDSPATEESQKDGLMPYPNLVNLVYTQAGKPAILSKPNFHLVNEAIYTQDNNMKRSYPNGVGGVKLYRTRSDYDRDAPLLGTPEVMTADSVAELSETFDSWWAYEPATGLTITNQVSGMFSFYTMNCNPALDATCKAQTNTNVSLNLCYDSTSTQTGMPITYPCSNANVLTPKIQGEKVMPYYWNSLEAVPPQSALDNAIRLLNVRFAFSILIIVMPVLWFILVVYTFVRWKTSSDMKPAPVATSEADIKKEGTDGGIALREVNGTAGI